MRLDLGKRRINFSAAQKKVGGNSNCSEQKQCGLIRRGGRARLFLLQGSPILPAERRLIS
jgi:hypothetical protein